MACLLVSLFLEPSVLMQVAVPDDVSDEAAAQFWVSTMCAVGMLGGWRLVVMLG